MVREGVVRAPVEEMEVVPVPPTARVFAEKLVVDALANVAAPVTVKLSLIFTPLSSVLLLFEIVKYPPELS
jgi:hypothetical protein